MAVSFINSSALGAINGADLTLTFSACAVANDVVVVINSTPRTGTVGTVFSSAGTSYTQIGAAVESGNLNTTMWYRQLTGVETTATASGNSNSADGHTAVAMCFRGTASPVSVASNSTIGSDANPNSPSASVSVRNSATISAMGLNLVSSVVTVPSSPGAFLNRTFATANDQRDTTSAMSWILSTSIGTVDPGAYTTGSAAWVAWTVVLGSTEVVAFTWQQFVSLSEPVRSKEGMIGY